MGYYTKFLLSITPFPNEELQEYLSQEYYFEAPRFPEENNEYFVETKWYTHQDDMRFLSLRFPKYLFKLQGSGEGTGDEWVEFYRNGKFYHVNLVLPIPDFDESFLK